MTETVMTLTRRSVFITSAAATDGDFRIRNSRLLCVAGLDNSGDTALLRHAELLAARTGSEVVLLHVVPEPSEALLYHAADGGARPLSRERAAVALTEVAGTLPLSSTTSVMVGDPDRCISLAASEHSVDLVLLSRASGGLQAAYDHDLADLLGKLHCPLLTIPVDARLSVQAINETRASRWQPKVVSAGVSAVQ